MPRSYINPKHVARSGHLVYFHVPQVLFSIRAGDVARKLLLITFGGDGSIFVQFPYFYRTDGVLRHLRFGDENPFPRRIMLAEDGHATQHLVKYSHHVDGTAHFSQDGKVYTRVRRQSFRLDGPIGHLFQFDALDLSGFEKLNPRRLRPKRPSIEVVYPSVPQGVHVVADWVRLASLAKIPRNPPTPVGPILPLADARTGARNDFLILAPPCHRTPEHVLLLHTSPAPVPAGLSQPTLVLIGGWDIHEVAVKGQIVKHTGALFCTYPADGDVLLRNGAVSIDLPAPSAA